jgi:HK97 family phage prohead protease
MTTSERAALHRGGWERRYSALGAPGTGLSFRDAGSATSTDGWTLSAYASTSGVPYTVHDKFGTFTETMARGAFGKTIASGADVVLRVNHEGMALGRTTSGTLHLAEDGRGLRYQATLDPSSPDAQSLRSAVARGDMSQSSFAMVVSRDSWNKDYTQRQVLEANLDAGDVGPVCHGANPDTGASDVAPSLRAKRAALSSAQINDLPDSAFAYIEPGGRKDSSGKTVPRSKRHFLIHDAAHVRNALARIGQGAAFGKQAMPAVVKAAAKFGINVSQANAARPLNTSRAMVAPGSPICTCCGMCAQSECDGTCCDYCSAGEANADIASDSTDEPSATQASMLALPNFDYEARIAILKAKGALACSGPSLTSEERRRIAVWESDRAAERILARARRFLEETKGNHDHRTHH